MLDYLQRTLARVMRITSCRRRSATKYLTVVNMRDVGKPDCVTRQRNPYSGREKDEQACRFNLIDREDCNAK